MSGKNTYKKIITVLAIILLFVFSPMIHAVTENTSGTENEEQTQSSSTASTTYIDELKKAIEDRRDIDEKSFDKRRNDIGSYALQFCQSILQSEIQPGSVNATPSQGGSNPVPVFEVDGLLELTGQILSYGMGTFSGIQSIDTSLQQINEVQNKMCYYLVRLQQLTEDAQYKLFVEDPAARANASLQKAEYSQNLIKLVNNGYDVDGDGVGDKSLIVSDLPSHRQEVRAEVTAQFDDMLVNSGSAYTDFLRRQLTIGKTNPSTVDALASDLSPSEIAQLYKDPKALDSKTYWDRYTLFFTGKNNNIYDAYLSAESLKNTMENIAIADDQMNYVTSGGFLPYQECLEQTSDGKHCLARKTITPGSAIASIYNTVMNDKFVSLQNVHYSGEDNIPATKPNIGNITNPDARDTLDPYTNLPINGPTEPPTIFDPWSDSIFKLNFTKNIGPANNGNGLRKVTLKIETNADSCSADSNWIGMKDTTSTNSIYLFKKGENIPLSNLSNEKLKTKTIDTYYPLTFDMRFAYTNNNGSQTINLSSTTDGVTKKVTVSIPTSILLAINTGDKFSLSVSPFGSNQTVSTTTYRGSTSYEILRSLRDEINKSSDDEWGKYTIDLNESNQLTISMDRTYKLKCRKGQKTKIATVTVEALSW
jgi:hypothetical protein